ncbi:MAG: hypothetical protein KJ607_11430 [Bacteroidetes bacterium]|nr:hypothetical protein [Bacteroidota bacterium]
MKDKLTNEALPKMSLTVFRNGKKENKFKGDDNGACTLVFEHNQNYKAVCEMKGYYTEEIMINTTVPILYRKNSFEYSYIFRMIREDSGLIKKDDEPPVLIFFDRDYAKFSIKR